MTPWIGLCLWLSLFVSTVFLVPISRIWPDFQQQAERRIQDKLAKTRETLLTTGTAMSLDKAFAANASWGYQHSLQQSLNAHLAPGGVDGIWVFTGDCQVLAASSVRKLSAPHCQQTAENGKLVATTVTENEALKSAYMLALPMALGGNKTGTIALVATLDDEWIKAPPHLAQGLQNFEIHQQTGAKPQGLVVFSGARLSPPLTDFYLTTRDSWLALCHQLAERINTTQLWSLSLLWGALALVQLVWISLRKSKLEQKNRAVLLDFATWCSDQELRSAQQSEPTTGEQLATGGFPALQNYLQQQLLLWQQELRAAKDRNVTIADRLAAAESIKDDQYGRIQELIPESLKGCLLRERMETTTMNMLELSTTTIAQLKSNLDAVKDQVYGQHLILVEWNEHLAAVGIRKFLKEALESEKELTNPAFSRELQRLATNSQELCLKLKTHIALQQGIEEKVTKLAEAMQDTMADAAAEWPGNSTWAELFQRLDRTIKNFFPADHVSLEWDASLMQREQSFSPPPFDLGTLQQLIMLGTAALATQCNGLAEQRDLRFSLKFCHPGSRSGIQIQLLRQPKQPSLSVALPADGQRYLALMQMHLGMRAAAINAEPAMADGDGTVILVSWERTTSHRQSARQSPPKSPVLHHY